MLSIQDVWLRFLRVLEVVDEAVTAGSYEALEKGLARELSELGRELIQQAVEAVDERLREHAGERPGWVIVRRNDVKELLTPFGPVRYGRTYFRNKATGEYRYLADDWLGLTPHARVAPSVKATLVEKAAETSYRKSGQWSWNAAWQVSGQTVMNALRQRADWTPAWTPPKQRRQVPYVYVEADEDHVPSQDREGARWQPRLVYVHEGAQEQAGERKLRNVFYFGGLYRGKTEALYEAVWRYLDAHYELEAVRTIFVSGDGAPWIRQLVEFIPGSVFVLDRFHAAKKLRAAVGGWEDLYTSVWEALERGDRRTVRKLLKEAAKRADKDNRRRAIEETLTYFMRQWDGIEAWSKYKDALVGRSAEGHVSHVYAARMSSRPMAWSEAGVDCMAHLRVLQANGESIRDRYLQGHKQLHRRPAERWHEQLRRTITQGKKLVPMLEARLPVLHGRRTMLTRALRALIDAV